MRSFIVNVSHLTDSQLEFFGWVKFHQGDEFTTYWNPRYNEYQLLNNEPPRYLTVDDWNDAQALRSSSHPIIAGPSKRQ